MKLPEHKHDYSRIDQLVSKMDILTLTHHLNIITSNLCQLVKESPNGKKGEAFEQLNVIININAAFKDIIVDEYVQKLKNEK